MSDFLTPFVKALTDAVAPLETGFSSKQELEALLFRHGWDIDVDGGELDAINTAFAVAPLFEAVLDNLDELTGGSDEARLRATLEVLEALKALIEHIAALAPGGIGGLSAPFDQGSFWSELAEGLVEDLLVEYLRGHQSVLFALLHLAGVIRFERVVPAGAHRVPYTRSRIAWEQLGAFFASPYDALNELYAWNKPGEDFKHDALLAAIERAFLSFGVRAAVQPPRPALAAPLLHDQSILDGVAELELPIVDGISPSDRAFWKIGAVLLPVADPVKTDAPPNGLAVSPILQGELALRSYFGKDVYLELTGAFDAEHGIVLRVYPDEVALDSDLGDAVVEATMALVGAPAEPWILLGSPESSRFELEGFYASYGIRGRIDDLESVVSIGTTGPDDSPPRKMRLVIQLGGGDAFVESLSGGNDVTVEFAGTLSWSSKHGFAFEGQAGFELAIPLHLELGPVEVSTLYLALAGRTRDGTASLDGDFGVGIVGKLGPLTAVVENIGLRASLVPLPAGSAGAAGNADFALGFKPPNGVGLSLDAGAVKGGGYLFFDFDKEEYAGALELSFSGIVSVKALGLITTRMPDGSKGFSLLVIITAEFGTPIQLGFGFTLSGVGGLLGLNRTMKLEPLAEGIRTGAVNGIMFPTNVVENAPRILSDLKAFFPPANGIFLIGPMAKLGWGTPNLVTLSLGLIIEIPGNVAIVGILKVALPTEEAALLRLQVNFIGAIEFDKQRGWFYASLYESRVLFITLEGDMGILVAWGPDPNFVVSVGGFHPAFEPPPLPFPEPARIALTILNTSWAKLRVEGYFAVTSNTVQFGARAELFFGISEFNIEGHLAFDALFRFSPFYMIVEFSSSLSVKVFGIGLFSVRMRGSLEGPAPWRVDGTGSISLLFFDIEVDFSHTWGEEADTVLPPVEVMPLVKAEIDKLENWRAEVPVANRLYVSLREIDAAEALVLHPVGTLKISQRAVPLDLAIDKVGSQKPSDAKEFRLSVAGGGFAEKADVDESFAMAQFKDMDDAKKLSSPAFEPQQGGLELAAEGTLSKSAAAVKRVLRYEQIVIDTSYKRFVRPFYNFFGVLFGVFVKGNAAARAQQSFKNKKQRQPFDDKIEVQPNRYAVAVNIDNSAFDAGAASFASRAKAEAYMSERVAADPKLADTLHVVPAVELKRAA